jgi:hypothetical protein
MYLAGVSLRRVEDLTEALWGMRVSASAVSELNQKIYTRIEQWRNRPIEGEHPYVFLDGIWLERSWGGEVEKVAVLVAIGVAADGHHVIRPRLPRRAPPQHRNPMTTKIPFPARAACPNMAHLICLGLSSKQVSP